MLRDTNRGIPWSEAQIEALDSELANLQFADRFADMLRGERVFGLAILRAMQPNTVIKPGRGSVAAPIGTRLYPSGWKKLWLASMCDAIQQRIECIELRGLRETVERTFETAWFPPQPFAARDNPMAAQDSVMKASLIYDTEIIIARVALAAARWRLAKGVPPANLTELAACFPAGLPDDPLTGQSLRYEATAGGGFTVSSPGYEPGSDEDDLVWKVAHAPGGPPIPPAR